MEFDRDLEEQLRKGLESLYRQTSEAKKDRENANEIQMGLDHFDMEWQDKINVAEKYELRGCIVGIREATKEFDLSKRMENYMRDSAALPAMAPEQQVAFWNGTRREFNLEEIERSQGETSDQVFEEARQSIQDRYSDMREGLIEAINTISEGKEPALNFLLEVKQDKLVQNQSKIDDLIRAANDRSQEYDREQ